MLFVKGFIIGLGKIMPGVSGALLAINFGIYEKLLDTLTNFFSNWKNNLKFLLVICSGGLLAIVFGSKLLLYLFDSYKFITMLFFIGLIAGGIYNFSKEITYSWKELVLLLLVIGIFLLLNFYSFTNNSLISKNNSLIFFLGGFIEVFASIVPGISATSLLMMMGIYNTILKMIANVYNFNFVINHLNLYFCYGLGIIVSFIINIYLINYLIKKYHNTSYTIVLGLSLASIIYLIFITFKLKFNLIELLIGIMLFLVGVLFANLLNK